MRKSAPPNLAMFSAPGWALISAPMPAMPAEIRTMSETVHSATTGSTCSRRMPWRSTKAFCAPTSPARCALDDVEYATIEWVDWFNNRRLHSQLDYIPPDEYEAAYCAHLQTSRPAAPQQWSRHQTRDGSYVA